jgi:two-component system KDP operon response regulator KdpE
MSPPFSPTPDTGDPRPQGKAVLVIDDDPLLRQSVQWTLEDEGLTVAVAADGREALAHAARLPPALVVLDHGLPDRRGDAVAAALRRSCGTQLPILLITGDGRAQQKAAEMGAFAYLHKPFDMDRLVTLVHSGLGARPQG